MEYLFALAGLAVIHLVAVISPGPSFVVVARIAIGRSRRAALIAAAAMTLGALLWAAAALFGLQALFARYETLYLAMRLAGGAYLLWIAFQLLRHAGAALPEAGSTTVTGPQTGSASIFRDALLVQLANPKVAVFFSSIFLALLPAEAPGWIFPAVLAIVGINEFAWYAAVSLLFSAGPARELYRRSQLWIDRIAGFLIAGLGLRLMLDVL